MIYIDETTKAMSIPSKERIIGASGDRNVGQLDFSMDRFTGALKDKYTDGKIFVMFKPSWSDKWMESEVYEVDLTDESISFPWVISPAATAQVGSVLIGLCVKWFDDDGATVIDEWHSGVGAFNCVEAGKHGIVDPTETYVDPIEQAKLNAIAALTAKKTELLTELESADASAQITALSDSLLHPNMMKSITVGSRIVIDAKSYGDGNITSEEVDAPNGMNTERDKVAKVTFGTKYYSIADFGIITDGKNKISIGANLYTDAAGTITAYLYDETAKLADKTLTKADMDGRYKALFEGIAIDSTMVSLRFKCNSANGQCMYIEDVTVTDTETAAESPKKYYDEIKAGSNLIGKKVAVLGDSISTNDYIKPYWGRLMQARTGAIVDNYGVSSTRITASDGRTDSFVDRYVGMESDEDIIFVMGGTNDRSGVTKGTFDSTDTTTMYGALNTLIKGLLSKYPGKLIAFATPIKKANEADSYEDPRAVLVNTAATGLINMQLIAEAIKVKCEEYGIPCLDLYNESGINGYDTNKVYYKADSVLHPSAIGQARLEGLIGGFLERLI